MFAVFKRNFTAYFLNPTGYVFLCVFVLLGSAAAFLPDDFVNSNLANLAQLDRRFPLIMLVFIPAITMGIWADERRFGTDELLLTAPLSPLQIVLGKYAAALGVYTVSLLFSAVSNYAILAFLGHPDIGLFLADCFGFWLTGLVMIALGMVASFLTPQLTVAYILGALFNVPLIAFQWADAAPIPESCVRFLQSASIASASEPFGRGLVTLSNVLYFLLIPLPALYLCLILVTARHWSANGAAGKITHYLFRLAASLVLVAALVGLLRRYDLRSDWTRERLGTLSSESAALIDRFTSDYPVVVEAYISPRLPPEYARTRIDALSVLSEMKSRLGNRLFLSIRPTEPNSPEAWRLRTRYDLRPKTVRFETRGLVREEPVFLSLIFKSGPKTVVLPFLSRGLSVEYELTSALLNVGSRTKKRIGILNTDAALFGRYDRLGNPILKPWPIIEELSRQYDVEPVDLSEPVETARYDLLLAVQPSSLGQKETLHFLGAVRYGAKTLLFEDPYPLFAMNYLAGTNLPKRPTAAGFTPKGDITPLWSLLGILFGNDVLWKNYNPYPKLAGLSEEFIFIDQRPMELMKNADESENNEAENSEGTDAANRAEEKSAAKSRKGAAKLTESFDPKEPLVASLEHLLLPFTGYLVADPMAGTDVAPLIQTTAGGTSSVAEIVPNGMRSYSRNRSDRPGVYVTAARITGPVPKMFRKPDEKTTPNLDVILVADVDLLTPGFFTLRELGADAAGGTGLDFDNVTFVLNAIDRLTGDDDLIAVRSRRARHRTLTAIDEATRKIRDAASGEQIRIMKEFESRRKAEEETLGRKIAELANRGEEGRTLSESETAEFQSAVQAMRQRLTRLLDEKQEEYNRKVEESQRSVNEQVRKIQGRYKLGAVLLPPIPPLAIGLTVWLRRRINRRKEMRK